MKQLSLSIYAILFFALLSFGQKKTDFEGSISYEIKIDESSNMPKEALMMFDGAEVMTYIKGEKHRSDVNMAMQSSSTIIDVKAKTFVTLMDIMGQKYLIRSTMDEMKKEEEALPDYKLNYTKETKKIAGYNCKKVEVSIKTDSGKEEKFDIYVTDEIPYTEVKNTYKGLKGFPLEYVISQGILKMTFTAKKVSLEKVPDSKFEIPKEGYKELNMEDFKKEMMNFGG